MSRRIVFLIDSFLGPWAGTERQLWYLLENIDRRQFEPHLLLLRDTEFSLSTQAWPCPVQVLGVKKLASLGGIRALAGLAARIRKLDAGIVHAYFQDASLMGPIAARLGGARFVAGRRDMGIWYTDLNLRLLKLERGLVDRVIANSAAVKNLVVAREGIPDARISVIYNGLDQAEGAGSESDGLGKLIPADAPVIGIVANLRAVKRHADLIRAFARIKQAVPAVHLVIVGEGELREPLQQLAASQGVSASTHFLGRIETVTAIVRRFTVGVICSESEGLSNAIMEYMKEAKPVVCTDVGGNPELVTDARNGFLYPVGDEDALVERLLRVLSDDGIARSMGAASAQAVETMTMSNMVQAHMAVYANMLQQSRSGSDTGETL